MEDNMRRDDEEEEERPPPSKELLYPSKGEESIFFIADGKDRVKAEKPNIMPLGPSQALSRARAFLPQMALANEKLKQEMITRPASEFDIESVDEAQPYIKMELGILEEGEGEEENQKQLIQEINPARTKPNEEEEEDEKEEEEEEYVNRQKNRA